MTADSTSPVSEAAAPSSADMAAPIARPTDEAVVEADCWTPRRREVLSWLRRNAPALSDLYEGAVLLLYVHPIPGQLRFVAHAVREIRNRLPGMLSKLKASKFDATSRLDALVTAWSGENLPTDGSFPEGFRRAERGQKPNPVAIPVSLYRMVAKILRDHAAGRERKEETALRLFEAVAPENKELGVHITPIVEQWIAVTEWFVQTTHESGRGDAFFDDVAQLVEGGAFEHTNMIELVPRQFLPRYDLEFAKRFLACLLTVAWKQRSPEIQFLSSAAEEMALHAAIRVAKETLRRGRRKADFTVFEETAFEDEDFGLLFDPASDGLTEIPEVEDQMHFVGLKFDKWFDSFEPEKNPAHPYADRKRRRARK